LSRSWESAFLDLHRQVDELFEELVYRPWAISARAVWQPPLDLHETADAYVVVIDLPEVSPEEMRILVGERDLVIAGQRQPAPPEGVLFQRCERPFGAFERTLKFSQAVDAQQARAEYRHGTCRIHLPKKQPGQATDPARAAEEARASSPGVEGTLASGAPAGGRTMLVLHLAVPPSFVFRPRTEGVGGVR
jgi:HSP20 family protein